MLLSTYFRDSIGMPGLIVEANLRLQVESREVNVLSFSNTFFRI